MTKRTRMEVKDATIGELRELMFHKKVEAKNRMIEEILDEIVNGKYDDLEIGHVVSVNVDKDKVNMAREHINQLGYSKLNQFIACAITNELEKETSKENEDEDKDKNEDEDKNEDKDGSKNNEATREGFFERKKGRVI